MAVRGINKQIELLQNQNINFLNMRIEENELGLSLFQTGYTDKILNTN